MSEFRNYGKPVLTITGYPDERTVRYARKVEGQESDYGLIVGEENGRYFIEYAPTPEYRDDTLIAFNTFYDSCRWVQRFGADIITQHV